MSARGLLKDSGGFTLVEMMISGGLLAIIVIAVTYEQTKQATQEAALNLQNQARGLVSQVTARILASPGDFPPYFSTSDGSPITYVACYSETGVAIPNTTATPSKEFFGVFLAGAANNPPPASSGICPASQGGFEARLTQADTGTFLDIIVLPSPGRQFTPLSTVYRTPIILSSGW